LSFSYCFSFLTLGLLPGMRTPLSACQVLVPALASAKPRE
jgi:hypothetical protein